MSPASEIDKILSVVSLNRPCTVGPSRCLVDRFALLGRILESGSKRSGMWHLEEMLTVTAGLLGTFGLYVLTIAKHFFFPQTFVFLCFYRKKMKLILIKFLYNFTKSPCYKSKLKQGVKRCSNLRRFNNSDQNHIPLQ